MTNPPGSYDPNAQQDPFAPGSAAPGSPAPGSPAPGSPAPGSPGPGYPPVDSYPPVSEYPPPAAFPAAADYPPPGGYPPPEGQPATGYAAPTPYQPGGYPPGAYPGGGYPPPVPGMNVMAILALVFAFVFAPVAIVLGHVALRQLRTSGEQGETLARVGLILGYVFTGMFVLFCGGAIILGIIGAANSTPT